MNKKELFDKWVDRVMAYAAGVGPKINRHVAVMQSKPFFDRQSDILFLGINPAENGVYRQGICPNDARKIEYSINDGHSWHPRYNKGGDDLSSNASKTRSRQR